LPERLGTKSKNSLITEDENLNAKPACDTVKGAFKPQIEARKKVCGRP